LREKEKAMPVLFDPTAPPSRRVARLAARPASLDGKALGLLDIGKPKGDWYLEEVGALLAEHFALREVLFFRKPTYAKVAPPELAEEVARRCDAVVEGLAY